MTSSPTTIAVSGPTRKSTFLTCEECFGHGTNPNADPRCIFGCNKYITWPPSPFTKPAVRTFTWEILTEENEFDRCKKCLGEGINQSVDPRCEYGCTTSGPVPMMSKLIPNIDVRSVPLISHRQEKEYQDIIETLKRQQKSKCFNGMYSTKKRSSSFMHYSSSDGTVCYSRISIMFNEEQTSYELETHPINLVVQ